MDTKIGVYICKGCEIAQSIDLDKVTEGNNPGAG